MFSSSDKFFISLDIKFRDDKWVSILKSSKLKPNLIFMFLKNVGGRGVSFKNLRKLIKKLPGHSYHYAGGVKYPNQLRMLKNLGLNRQLFQPWFIRKLSSQPLMLTFKKWITTLKAIHPCWFFLMTSCRMILT